MLRLRPSLRCNKLNKMAANDNWDNENENDKLPTLSFTTWVEVTETSCGLDSALAHNPSTDNTTSS
jgi:hypothetical protein